MKSKEASTQSLEREYYSQKIQQHFNCFLYITWDRELTIVWSIMPKFSSDIFSVETCKPRFEFEILMERTLSFIFTPKNNWSCCIFCFPKVQKAYIIIIQYQNLMHQQINNYVITRTSNDLWKCYWFYFQQIFLQKQASCECLSITVW